MQETKPRVGRAAPQALSHKKAAAELEVSAELSSAPNPALQRHLCSKAPREELEITDSWVCFNLSPTLQHLGGLFGFKVWAVCSQTHSALSCALKIWVFITFRKPRAAQNDSQEEWKGKFKIQTHNPVVSLQQGKLLLEERGGPSFSKTPTTTRRVGIFLPTLSSSTNSLF